MVVGSSSGSDVALTNLTRFAINTDTGNCFLFLLNLKTVGSSYSCCNTNFLNLICCFSFCYFCFTALTEDISDCTSSSICQRPTIEISSINSICCDSFFLLLASRSAILDSMSSALCCWIAFLLAWYCFLSFGAIFLAEANIFAFCSSLFCCNHSLVLLLLNKMRLSKATVVALGFSLRNLLSCAKSRSLTVLVFGTDCVWHLFSSLGLS